MMEITADVARVLLQGIAVAVLTLYGLTVIRIAGLLWPPRYPGQGQGQDQEQEGGSEPYSPHEPPPFV